MRGGNKLGGLNRLAVLQGFLVHAQRATEQDKFATDFNRVAAKKCSQAPQTLD
jgi:hypothetical protein